MANEQRAKHMLMATGDNGSVSWQPVFGELEPEHADRVVAGGFISGPSQPAAVARELLLSLRPVDVRIGYATTYPFPVEGRASETDIDVTDDGTVAPVLPETVTPPSKADIVAALVYAVQLGSSTVVLNDNADRVLSAYFAENGVEDTSNTDTSDGETTTTTVY